MRERGVAYLAVVVAIDLGVFATQLLQLVEHLAPAPHLLHRVGREQVEVDKVQLIRVFTVVALGPFLRVADSAHRAEVCARHEVRLRLILYQVGERQFAGVGVVGMAPHHERESTYLRGPEQVTVGGGLRPALCHTLVDRT